VNGCEASREGALGHRILDHLRQKEQELPTQPLLVPPTLAPPGTLPLLAGKGAR
jgi:hypothetical protein